MPIYMGIFEKPNVLDKNLRGEVKAKGYEGWIELQSAQLGTSQRNATTATGRGVNREASAPAIQEIVVTKLQDSVSTALFREALGGKGKLIVIAFVKEGGTTYLKIVLQNTLITSYSVSGHGGDVHARPMESLSLNFTRITYEMPAKSPETTHSQMYELSQQANWPSYP
jgi:type VI secretion system secreted protein Hcp